MQRKFFTHIEFEPPRKLRNNVGIICPACGDEVTFDEIIEKKGSVYCVNCKR